VRAPAGFLAFVAAQILAAAPVAGQVPTLPATTLSCENFKKNADGSWSVVDDKPFTIGSTMATIGAGTVIRPRSVNLAGVDIYDLLEAKCAGSGGPR